MLINDILYTDQPDFTGLLRKRCSQFLEQAEGLPLFKNLPNAYHDFHKVKVRFRKSNLPIAETFNQAFNDELHNITQRAIFANGVILESEDKVEPFYIFPINSFKFMYNKEVIDSTVEYKHSFDKIFEQFEDDTAQRLISDLLTYTYTNGNLVEGIESGAEIVIYNIPYYYAVRSSTVDYEELLTYLT